MTEKESQPTKVKNTGYGQILQIIQGMKNQRLRDLEKLDQLEEIIVQTQLKAETKIIKIDTDRSLIEEFLSEKFSNYGEYRKKVDSMLPKDFLDMICYNKTLGKRPNMGQVEKSAQRIYPTNGDSR